ncbi:MAG: hypothetical protein QOD94_2324 [Alphaproteobacteria bacterium]|nr:hypothetical protein [Alphaproteobacteria bacterium]
MATKKKRRAWLAVEVKALRTSARNIVPAGKIARLLKRTEGAIRQKALALGLSLNSQRRGKGKKKAGARRRTARRARA